MKELYRKDPASHSGPESCDADREDCSEALTGEDAGEVLSHEIRKPVMPTPLSEAEGNSPQIDKARDVGKRRGRRPSACEETSWNGTGRSQHSAERDGEPQRAEKIARSEPAMDGVGKSEQAIVSQKQSNEPDISEVDLWGSGKETAERRACVKRNSDEQSMSRTQSRKHDMSQALERVRQRAKQDRKVRFTALLHHLSIEALRAAFQRLKVQAAAGADGLSWKTYSAELEDNLRRLHQRLQRGSYRPVPARRVYIPKADGRQRPLGIAALEDKILQSALCEVLNAIYETDFVGFSYGFRPGRNQHQALDAIVVGIRYKKVNWVLDADIRGYFDTIDHQWLQRFLQHRIGDQRVMRLIGKWLKAGVMEEGEWKASEEGTPQGATISPLLANIYLHYVFDLWMEQWRKRHARGEVMVVRYADDFIIGFQDQRDAQRFRVDLKERMEKFALSLNEGKTRLIEFGRYANERRKKRNEGKALTFDFLGFTHICSKASTGKLQILRRTIRKRRNAKLQAISEQLRYRREEPIAEQGAWLHRVLDGYYRYHAVHGNLRVLGAIRTEIAQRWYRSLRRRSHKRKLTWKKMHLHVTRWLPQPKVLHPWPEERFFARHNSR